MYNAWCALMAYVYVDNILTFNDISYTQSNGLHKFHSATIVSMPSLSLRQRAIPAQLPEKSASASVTTTSSILILSMIHIFASFLIKADSVSSLNEGICSHPNYDYCSDQIDLVGPSTMAGHHYFFPNNHLIIIIFDRDYQMHLGFLPLEIVLD